MFINIDEKEKERIKKDAEIFFESNKNNESAEYLNHGSTLVMCDSVAYYMRFGNKIPLFNLSTFESRLIFMIRRINFSASVIEHCESLKFLYIEWLVEELIDIATRKNKTKFIFVSKLPHITEVFSDLDFDKLSMVDSGEFKGIKFIKTKE